MAEDNVTLTLHEQVAVQKVLSSELILEMILSNVSSNRLFSLRLVSKKWAKISSQILDKVGLINPKKIELSHPSLEILATIRGFAQNLEHVKINKVDDFLSISKILWTFSSLKNVHIELIVGNEKNQFPYLDQAVTGLEEEQCHQLQNVKGEENIRRVGPSILDCKYLESFSIILESHSNSHYRRIQSLELFSTVSHEFGFKMMDNLKLTISCLYDPSVSVETIIPHAQ